MRFATPPLSRTAFARTGLAAATCAGTRRIARAQGTAALRIVYFPGPSILPATIGLAKGFFGRENLTVTLTPTAGSVYLFQHLSAGDFEIACTAVDNAIAYDEGQGEAQLAKPANFAAFMGGDDGFLRLCVRPEINSYADLRGKTLAVDALTTGYAFVLRKMLEAGGLHEGDYTFEAAGGTLQRYQKLTAGQAYAGTLLYPPFDLQGQAAGIKTLARASDVLGRYQGFTAIADRDWLRSNGDAVTRYVRAYLGALDWIYDPRNREETIRILAESTKVDPAIAAATYPVIVNRERGFAPKAQLDLDGVRTVLALRSAYGRPQKTLSDPLKYYDATYYRRVSP